MTKKKYRVFLDIITLFCILFPLLLILLTYFRNPLINDADVQTMFNTINTQFTLSHQIKTNVITAFNLMGISHSAWYYCFCTVISNGIIIYIGRVFLEVMIFIPKLMLKFMEDRS